MLVVDFEQLVGCARFEGREFGGFGVGVGVLAGFPALGGGGGGGGAELVGVYERLWEEV